jgi:hypothetical protein
MAHSERNIASRLSLGFVKRKEGEKNRSERGSSVILIPRESGGGGGPVHAPCLMRWSRFPDASLLSGLLHVKLIVKVFKLKQILVYQAKRIYLIILINITQYV